MSRNKRANSSLQTIAVLSVSVLFVLTALVGLYKCFSKPPEPSGGALPNQNSGADALQPDDAAAPQTEAGARRPEGGLLHHSGGWAG